jgi:hypothetical protein
MGTMSASDAAPLPRLGEVFFDVRGDSRSMRVSWYADTGVAVFSIWQGDTCTGTFRLPIPELPRMVEALTQGPPGRAGSGSRTGDPGARQADPGPQAAAMGPGGMPVPVPGTPVGDNPRPYRGHEETRADRGLSDPLSSGYPGSAPGGGYPDLPPGPGQDFSPQHGYGAPHAGYAATAPSGYREGPPTARYTDTGPGGYQGPAPGGQHQTPQDGYYREPAPEAHRDLPPGDYYRGPAPEGHRDLPPGDYYQDLPPAGYRDLPAGSGYQDVPPGSDYRAPDDGYREPPAAAPPGGPAQFGGRQQDPYPPTGPLPVGRWRSDEPSGDFPRTRPEDGSAADGYAEDRSPAAWFATGEFAPDGYPGEEFAQDEFAADDFPDDPLADSYQGEAEQGYLPSPPTDMFPAAALSGDYPGQGSHRAGYEPDSADLDHDSPYPVGGADRGGAPPDSGAQRPGRDRAREREYGHSRGRS